MTTATSGSPADGQALRIVHTATGADTAAPAVLVTAWLLADLGDSPAVLVEQVGTSEIHLRPVEHADGATSHTLRARVAALLSDARLAGWTLGDADMTRTLLEPEASHHVRKADCS